MLCIVYISSAVLGLSENDIVSIVRNSQKSNKESGITGILLYSHGNFMQLIEGDDVAVELLYKKISKDRRHTNISLLYKEKITHSLFSGWLMGYKNLDNMKKFDEASDSKFSNEDLNFENHIRNPHRALQFLEVFKNISA